MRLAAPLLALVLVICTTGLAAAAPLPRPQIAFAPRGYLCLRTNLEVRIDGVMDELAWNDRWSEPFVDIQGDLCPAPHLGTRFRMLWDDEALYIGAELQEPHVWATLVEHDAIIYHDNDFEVFIDPDGDTHDYFELEINALNTVWDLFLERPYRDGGPAVHAWDIAGLCTAVAVRGTLNRPGDLDAGWTVEIAIPWAALAERAGVPCPPRDGDRWRLNFSRVQWAVEAGPDGYRKLDLPEDNWVWSPQGLIDMHYPEMWGIMEFEDLSIAADSERVVPDRVERAGWALRQVYYAQRDHHAAKGAFTPFRLKLDLDRVALDTSWFAWPPHISAAADSFSATTRVTGRGALAIDQTGRLWWTDDAERPR
ncbi:carbohydrate-binding family 9-like protein [bacterium]|nr:carbohydrate-binding family 9-like protein [bacterium]MBU1675195.1 carbohydrate-binding family 9-like protein [bacterium]